MKLFFFLIRLKKCNENEKGFEYIFLAWRFDYEEKKYCCDFNDDSVLATGCGAKPSDTTATTAPSVQTDTSQTASKEAEGETAVITGTIEETKILCLLS